MLLLFLPTQLGKHFWPSFSSVAGIRIDYLSPTLYVTDVLIAMLFIATCFDVFKKRAVLQFLKRLRRFLVKKSFFTAGLIAVILGACLASTPLLSGYYLFRFWEIIFVAYSTKWFLEKSPNSPRLFLYVLLVALFLESAFGVSQFLLQHSIGGIMYFIGERKVFPDMPGVALASLSGELVLRSYGTFSHPNVLAGFLLVTGGIVSSILFHLKNEKTLKKITIFVFSLAVIALLLTLSRTTIIVLLCNLLLLLVVSLKSLVRRADNFLRNVSIGSLRFYLASVMVAGVVTLSLLLVPVVVKRFLAHDFFEESLHERLILAGAAVRMIYDSPLYGVGAGQFISELPRYVSSLHFSLLQPVHNIFLLLLAETGLLGFVGAMSIVAANIKTQIMRKKKIILLPLFFCLLLGTSDHYFLTQQQGRLIASIAVGIIFIDWRVLGHRLRKNTKKD